MPMPGYPEGFFNNPESFKASNYNPNETRFTPASEGVHEMLIKDVRGGMNKAGDKKMLTIQLAVNDQLGASNIYHYIVENQSTQKNMNLFLSAFGIAPGAGFGEWINKKALAKIKHEDYNGGVSAKIDYFLTPQEAALHTGRAPAPAGDFGSLRDEAENKAKDAEVPF